MNVRSGHSAMSDPPATAKPCSLQITGLLARYSDMKCWVLRHMRAKTSSATQGICWTMSLLARLLGVIGEVVSRAESRTVCGKHHDMDVGIGIRLCHRG